MNRLRNYSKNMIAKARGFLAGVRLRMFGCRVGRGLKCSSFPRYRVIPKGNIRIGARVNMGYNLMLEAAPGGRIIIGDRVDLSQDVLISSACSVEIGNFVLIGERVSIRDADHGTSREKEIMHQASDSAPIRIEDDVWIGANSVILKGCILQKGSVIGANSTLIAGTVTEPYGIYAGSPARLVGRRQ
ncbi:MAG: acyltransferase [Flavobacteriales bacterium]